MKYLKETSLDSCCEWRERERERGVGEGGGGGRGVWR